MRGVPPSVLKIRAFARQTIWLAAGAKLYLKASFATLKTSKRRPARKFHPAGADSDINTGGHIIVTEEIHEARPDFCLVIPCRHSIARRCPKCENKRRGKAVAQHRPGGLGHAKAPGLFHLLLGRARRKNLAANRQMEHGIPLCRIAAERRRLERHRPRPRPAWRNASRAFRAQRTSRAAGRGKRALPRRDR